MFPVRKVCDQLQIQDSDAGLYGLPSEALLDKLLLLHLLVGQQPLDEDGFSSRGPLKRVLRKLRSSTIQVAAAKVVESTLGLDVKAHGKTGLLTASYIKDFGLSLR